ncbi:UDP binding domain-containing protein [uncultured Desulfobacter sp.]|uniref:UDP binding domain-containing protein n=1 Tax=uncultured Desulfobacter sp. TaxID=240139 RepID=UPI002AAC16AA|nr:UDP binding domain-containing protein [uncultured Desulfobacter sp.]
MEFIEKLLFNKKVSVWGGGYLGYSYIIRLQKAGFMVNWFDFGGNPIIGILDGSFPSKVQKESWSSSGDLPQIDIDRVKICKDACEMFDSVLHIISFPALENRQQNRLIQMRQIIMENLERLDSPLFLFQSAEVPRTIENSFIKAIEKEKCDCYYASAFRSDWTIEEFLTNSSVQIVSGYNPASIEKAKYFFGLMGMNCEILSSIEEAEIYENARKAAHFILSAFLNQMSLSYPAIDIRKMTQLLIKNIGEQKDLLNIGALQYKIASSIDHLVAGIKAENHLSILKDAEAGNISILFKYADLIKKKGAKTVCIFGISAKNTYKDIRFSPSVILSEYLHKSGMEVFIDDPCYDEGELISVLPFAQYFNINTDKMVSDALFIFRDHGDYRFLSQKDIEEKGISNTKVVIDDVGLFKDFKFSEKTLYHIPGDGNLIKLQ